MENAAEALKMAAAVLVFVLALGVSISSFSQARTTAQILIENTDRESEMTFVEENGSTERIVGKETIVPTIYRAYKENYKIVFYDSSNNPIPLYTKKENGAQVDVNYIDLEQDVLGNDRQKDNFIMALLYGAEAELKKQDGTDMSFEEFVDELKENNSGINLNRQGIYDRILEGKTFVEKFGIYYQEDLKNTNSDTGSPGSGGDLDDEYGESKTPDTNKTKKRVISYFQQ